MKKWLFYMVLLNPVTVFSQNIYENTLKFDSYEGTPEATLSVLNFITGHWQGEAFGGITEEIWSPALGGSMMCVFKLVVEGNVLFYEICTITEEDNTLILRLKHFNRDLKGWEEKEETVDFRLVKVEKNRVYFDEFTFEKVNDNEMNIYVVIQNRDEENEVKFNYRRLGADKD